MHKVQWSYRVQVGLESLPGTTCICRRMWQMETTNRDILSFTEAECRVPGHSHTPMIFKIQSSDCTNLVLARLLVALAGPAVRPSD